MVNPDDFVGVPLLPAAHELAHAGQRRRGGERVQVGACSRAPLRKPGHAVDITARIERGQVLGGLIGGYQQGSLSDAKILVRG